jgi:hypothetical protein
MIPTVYARVSRDNLRTGLAQLEYQIEFIKWVMGDDERS